MIISNIQRAFELSEQICDKIIKHNFTNNRYPILRDSFDEPRIHFKFIVKNCKEFGLTFEKIYILSSNVFIFSNKIKFEFDNHFVKFLN